MDIKNLEQSVNQRLEQLEQRFCGDHDYSVGFGDRRIGRADLRSGRYRVVVALLPLPPETPES